MKKHIFILAIIFLFARCQQQDTPVIDTTDPETISKTMEAVTVPSQFDWLTTSSVSVTVNPDTKYNNYYLIEIFENNPIIDPTAVLLSSGLAKSGEPLSANVSTHQSLKTLYIKETDPTGKQIVKEYKIDGTSILADFNESAAGKSTLRSNNIKSLPSGIKTSYPTPSDAKIISNDGGVTSIEIDPSKYKHYVIKGTYTGTIKFNGWGQGVEVYIEGTWVNDSKSIHLGNGDKIILQQGSKFVSKEDLSITMDNASTILVSAGASFNSNDPKNIQIKASNNSEQLINLGTLYAGDVSRVKTIYNAGTMTLKSLDFDTSGTLVENDKLLTINTSKLTNGTINNNCKLIYVENVTSNQAIINIRGGALLQTPTIEGNGAIFNLSAGSMLKVTDEAVFTSNTSKIVGIDDKYALVTFKKETSKGWNGIDYSGHIEIECSEHTKNGLYSIAYTLNSASGARIVPKGGSTIAIQATDCNSGGNKVEDGNQTTPPSFPIPVSLGTTYTYAFEDTYPNIGDYDMNDFVGDANISYKMSSINKMTELTLNINLRAAGATNPLAVAVQLDGISRSNVSSVKRTGPSFSRNIFDMSNGIENGQTYAVIPVVDDVHAALGSSKYTFVNTRPEDPKADPKLVSITVTFASPIDISNLNILNMINLFVIVDNAKSNNRKEIHLRNYSSTDKSKDNSSGKHYNTKNNLVYGLRIAGSIKYPQEWKSIISAYPKFESWITSGGTVNQDWLDHPNTGNIYAK